MRFLRLAVSGQVLLIRLFLVSQRALDLLQLPLSFNNHCHPSQLQWVQYPTIRLCSNNCHRFQRAMELYRICHPTQHQ